MASEEFTYEQFSAQGQPMLKVRSDVMDSWKWVREDNHGDCRWVLWALKSFKTGKGRLINPQQGSGGLPELQALLSTAPEERVHIAILAIKTSDNAGSTRQRLARFHYIPSTMSTMQKSRTTVCQSVIAAEFDCSIKIDCDETDFANMSRIITVDGLAENLLSCGGAHPPTLITFGPDLHFDNSENVQG